MADKIKTICLLVIITASTTISKAQDWAQWRGPNQDGVVNMPNINLDWSEKQPTLLWTFRQAGTGYSAPVVVGTTLYSQGASDEGDFAFALDIQTGNLIWKQILGSEFVQDRGNGGRGSVTVASDKLYLIRGGGQIHCLSTVDGTMIWQKDFRNDFGGDIMSRWDWGFSESPLVDGELVICIPGGEQGAVIALNKNTGNVVWRSTKYTALSGYTSPIVAEIEGVRQYIVHTNQGVAGISAKDGKLLWKVDMSNYERVAAVCPTPIFYNNIVYITSGYNAGSAAIRLTKNGDTFDTEILYTTSRNMINQHGGIVLMNGYIYGFSDNSGWTCQNFLTGESVWNQRSINGLGKGAVLGINDRLLCLDEREGFLVVLAASPEGVREFGKIELPERSVHESLDNMVWTHPVVANGKLYLRDHELIFCFDLAK